MRAVGFHNEPYENRTALGTTMDGQGFSSSRNRLHPRAEIELYCERNSHQLIDWYEPVVGESANDFDARHDRYRKMVASFTGEGARLALVLVPDASHIAEDLETLVSRLLELERLGTEVRCTDPDRPDALQSGEELLGLGDRSPQRQAKIREAVVAKASRGEVLGRTPYGYLAGPDGMLKPVEDEAAIVQEIFKTYAGPWHPPESKPTGGLGMRAIARSLNERGQVTRTGRPWSALAISGILKNRTYLGTYSRYGVRIAGNHDPLVERDIFVRVEKVIKSRTPVRKPGLEPPYLLGGVARCDLCGRGLFGLTRRRSWKRNDGTVAEKTYRYYECPSRDATRERTDLVLRHSSRHAQDLELIVFNVIGTWGKRIKKKIRPDLGYSLAEELADAEREFSRAVRSVAAAYGTLSDLDGPLRRLTDARSGAVHKNVQQPDVEAMLVDIHSEDTLIARKAIKSILERVIVSDNSVEVIPRM
ncbi:MAG: recombinase family protein [Chloroflexota bacterium]|nr:recombinase family protein [Chloroflexota bacterium]